MAHSDCPHCGKTIYSDDSSKLYRLMQEHIQREHTQGYRRSDSWRKCHCCGGTGKDVYGIPCKYCDGSGVE